MDEGWTVDVEVEDLDGVVTCEHLSPRPRWAWRYWRGVGGEIVIQNGECAFSA